LFERLYLIKIAKACDIPKKSLFILNIFGTFAFSLSALLLNRAIFVYS